ncbi:MAG: hypothetical protein DRI57_04245 [Deltaproteobacteria bacterium]|nr:MAG: hypothetical protein DRI57_04245 [Deltaproteobacteria bacterium]
MRENVCYGNDLSFSIESVMQQADLAEILERLPDGPDTRLGESGGLVWEGGEWRRWLEKGILK